MRNLIRVFRIKLPKNEKLISYIKYALGEVALIIVGILIALQANNLSENRKSERYGLLLLNEMHTSLLKDSTELSKLIVTLRELQTLSESLKTTMQSLAEYNDTLSKSFATISTIKTFSGNNVAYQNLNLTNLTKIRNNELRQSILHYYTASAHTENVSLEFKATTYWRQNIYPKYFKSFRTLEKAEPVNYEQLRRSSEIFVALDYVYNDCAYLIRKYKQQLQLNSELRVITVKELQKRGYQ
ncbi:DUF6090 family protein [Mangrovibacterium diazotrophicum]|uniref:Uncharacterized protein n=1 Tax=Mangrovibacterium diazotrophicum TaxID=1261403 RepID=A0A419VU20_9BACT|nr:DUF6090 family protein [Mangrovibacterium diazotrophicum]RKD85020.1 hypothetical protein BC643_4539 [Mangrovibacterium diazotrophicum]